MALSAPNTPRATPKRSRYLQSSIPQTPDCYNAVQMETPKVQRKRGSDPLNDHDKFDEVSNLKVAVRIRPMNARELNVVGATDIVKVNDKNLIINAISSTNYNLNLHHIFQYDYVFWSCDETHKKTIYSSQEDVFEAIGKPLLKSAFCGYNACLFAYGQTGSGKSYSMMGKESDNLNADYKEAGITPRFCKLLFDRLATLPASSSATVEVSYFEIYNEKIHDLLTISSPTAANRLPLKVREHPVWGPYVVDLTTKIVKSYEELKNWMIIGNRSRATAATYMNEKSSRSHSILTIELNLLEGSDAAGDGGGRRSKVSLVDLAGSERLATHGSNNEGRIRQGVCINKSLLTLGKVISALADQKKSQQFVPYRDSVLTWLLRESLGGNSLTCMLATITPASCNVDETLATLRYACQARTIVNRARINESAHDRLIRELRAEVDRLRSLRQDYERNSFSSSYLLQNSSNSATWSAGEESAKELEDLRNKLVETEVQLESATANWEQKLIERKRQLDEAEQRREELESHLRIMKTDDAKVNLSPYKTNFLQQLENVLTVEEQYSNEGEKENVKAISKIDVTQSMNQIYDIMASFVPFLANESEQLLFARTNKLLQKLETTLNNVVQERPSKNMASKVVTFQV